MKIKIGAYPGTDPQSRLTFLRAGQEGISLVFARRLAAYVEYVRMQTGKPTLVMRISSGYRDVAYQQKLYDQNIKQYPPRGNGYVAKPGNSWHSGRVAVDLQDDNFWKGYMMEGDMHKTRTKQELYKFGLYLPLNYVDASSVFEWWHIQPVELYTYKGDRTEYLDPDDKIYSPKEVYKDMDVKEFQRITGLVPDNIIGAKTKAKAEEVLRVVNYILSYKMPLKPQPEPVKTVKYEKVGITDIMYVNPLDLHFAKVNKQAKDISHKHFVNGMQFGSKDGKVLTIGTGYSEGNKITTRLAWDTIERGTFIVHRDGSVTVEQMIDPEQKYNDIWFCVQNVGLNPIDLKAEWWPDGVGRTTNRIAIGYNPTLRKVILTHRPDSNMQRARETLANLGCVQGSKVLGIVLDSGTPATFKCNGIYYRNGGYMDNIIYVE